MRFLLGIITLVVVPVVAVAVVMRLLGGGGVAAPLSGAIFTTTPNGGIVNENVRYERKIEVYLDGGPGPNAPQTAAGLPDGDYYFQVTDPSGKVLLSEDPAMCRKIQIQDGVIVGLLNLGATYDPPGPSVFPCHIQDGPDGAAGSSGRHDTNTDGDHGPPAIVVQFMPFFDTPNPGGVYKAWIIPASRYVANGGNPGAAPTPQCVRNGRPANNCNGNATKIGYVRDPGFGPPRDQVKTDNFKVREFFPPEIKVRKFHDENGNGVWDTGEPEIGVDQCVGDGGKIVPCPGGWPYDFTYPLDGDTHTQTFYTPHTHVAGVAGVYTACEQRLSGWTQTAAFLDNARLDEQRCVNVIVAGTSGEKHEIIFGNTRPGEVRGRKVIDLDADGNIDEDGCPIDPDPWGNNAGCQGVTVHLDGTDNMGNSVHRTDITDNDGYYEFTDVWPGTYTITVDEPDGFFCSFPGPGGECNYNEDDGLVIDSGDVLENLDFGDFSLAEVHGIKFFDRNGDGVRDGSEESLPDWEIHLDGTENIDNPLHPDGSLDVRLVTWTCGGSQVPDCNGEPVGSYWFVELVPGDYAVSEVQQPGFVQTAPQPVPPGTWEVSLTSDQVCSDKDFANFGPCDGLTPGYWSNWRNHYTEDQFTTLLAGTVASSIEDADSTLDSVGCDGDDALHCMKRFLLANQLTLNLTQHPELPNPDGAGLVRLCSIEGVGTLQSAIDDALEILANPESFGRDATLAVKNRLAAFAELNG
jgi:uncharacterized protein (DUF2141 family)